MNTFQVYVIHSTKPIQHLSDALTQCGGFIYMGIIYKSLKTRGNRNLGKEETKKTITFCKESTVRQLEMSYPEFKNKIADYNWESFPLPSKDIGETWHLHISGVPNDYTDVEAVKFVVDSLNCILPQKETFEGKERYNFHVEFPIRLRETGEISGYGKVMFSEHVDHEVIKLCKLILHNTPRPYKNGGKRMVNCIWHRDPRMLADQRILTDQRKEADYYPRTNRSSFGGFKAIRKARPAVSSDNQTSTYTTDQKVDNLKDSHVIKIATKEDGLVSSVSNN